MGAGNAGASRLITLNGNLGGGSKKQGTPSTLARKSGIKYGAGYGNNRQEVFHINQLGGVGKGRSMFSPSADGVRTHTQHHEPNSGNDTRTLYYSLRDSNNDPFVDTLNFSVTNLLTEYRGLTITALTNETFAPIIGTSVVFLGHRVPNLITGEFTKKIYDERFTVTDKDGDEFSAAKVYEDDSTGFETTVESVSYNMIYATGKYQGKKVATILFDNNGNSFGNGRSFARKITFS